MTIDRHLIYKGAPVGTAPTGDARPAGREISVRELVCATKPIWITMEQRVK
jgi:hypothetical protein